MRRQHSKRNPPKEAKKKTLAQMSDKELQALINQMEYNRIKLPKSAHPNIFRVWEQYTQRINFVTDLLNARKNVAKKDEN